MPILSGCGDFILEKPHRQRKIVQVRDQEVGCWKKDLRVFHPSLETKGSRSRRLQVDITPRAQLRLMAFHQFHPALKLRSDIDAQADSIVRRLGLGRDRILEMMFDCVRGLFVQFAETTVAGQSSRMATKLTNDNVIGMLIADRGRREQDIGPFLPDSPRDGEIVRGRRIETAIASQIEKLDRCAEQFCRFSRFCFAFLRRAVRARLAA